MMIMKRFFKNLAESEFSNTKVWLGILGGAILTVGVARLLPDLEIVIQQTMAYIIAIGLPVTLFGIYDGILKDD